jgi:hypothetical protein
MDGNKSGPGGDDDGDGDGTPDRLNREPNDTDSDDDVVIIEDPALATMTRIQQLNAGVTRWKQNYAFHILCEKQASLRANRERRSAALAAGAQEVIDEVQVLVDAESKSDDRTNDDHLTYLPGSSNNPIDLESGSVPVNIVKNTASDNQIVPRFASADVAVKEEESSETEYYADYLKQVKQEDKTAYDEESNTTYDDVDNDDDDDDNEDDRKPAARK